MHIRAAPLLHPLEIAVVPTPLRHQSGASERRVALGTYRKSPASDDPSDAHGRPVAFARPSGDAVRGPP